MFGNQQRGGESVLASQDREGRLKKLGWLIWGACVVLSFAGLYLFLQNLHLLSDMSFPGFYGGLILSLGYATVGLLIIAKKPSLPFGWLFTGIAGPAAVANFSEMYALYGFFVVPEQNLPGVELAGWLQTWVIYLAFPAPIALLCMLFPDGRLPSARWRWAAFIAILATLLLVINEMVSSRLIPVYITEPPLFLQMSNPTYLRMPDIYHRFIEMGWVLAIISLPLGLLALVVRFRTATGVARRQLKWFVYFAAVGLVLFPLGILKSEWVGNAVLLFVILLLPVGTTLAILRHNLYDIDIIIRRTLIYAFLTAILGIVYFALVILLQSLVGALIGEEETPLVIVLSTLAIAVLFNPVHKKIQAFIDRRFYRSKYNARQAMDSFSVTVREEVDIERLAAELLGVVEQAIQPVRSSIWLRETDAEGHTQESSD